MDENTNVVEMPAAVGGGQAEVLPKFRKKPETCRNLGELYEANPKTMTTKEAAMLITQLREDLILSQNKLHEATITAQKAFEQYRVADENYRGLSAEHNAKMRQVEDMTRVFHMSIKMLGGSR